MNKSQQIMLPLVVICLAACQAQPNSESAAQNKSVTLTATRCFGACPSYDLTIYADGRLAFDGKQNTAYKGKVQRQTSPEIAKIILNSVSEYRPGAGQKVSNMPCKPLATDHPSYVLKWGEADKRAVYRHYTGCFDAKNKAFSMYLSHVLERVGIKDLVKLKRKRK